MDLSGALVRPSANKPSFLRRAGVFLEHVWQSCETLLFDSDAASRLLLLGLIVTPLITGVVELRRKRRVFPALAWTAGLLAGALLVSSLAGFRRLTSDEIVRYVVRSTIQFPLPMLGFFLATLAIVLLGRTGGGLAALLPLFGGFAQAWREVTRAETIFEDGSYDTEQMSRILSEVAGETLEPVVIGCLYAGLLLVVVGWFHHRKRDGAVQRRDVAVGVGAIVIVAAARLLLRPVLTATDGIVIAGFAAVVLLLGRTDLKRPETSSVLVILTGALLLLDVGARLRGESVTLDVIAGESIDPSQVARILQEGIRGGNLRLALLLLDVILFGLLAARRLGTAPKTALAPLVSWIRTPSGLVTTIGVAVVLVLASATLDWTGRYASFRALRATTGEALSADTTATSSKDALKGMPELGPLLIVDRKAALYATPRAGVKPEPYGPPVFDRMAEAAAESGAPPVVVAPDDVSFDVLTRALAPLLGQQQYDVRLLSSGRGGVDLGVYTPLVTSRRSSPTRGIDLLPALVLRRGKPGSGAKPSVGFVYDGSVFHLVPLVKDSLGYLAGTFDLAGELSLQGRGTYEVVQSVEHAGADEDAVLAFAPDASVDVITSGIRTVGGLRPSSSRRVNLFAKIVVTPGRDALEALRAR